MAVFQSKVEHQVQTSKTLFDKLPFEHFSVSEELSFFVQVFMMMNIQGSDKLQALAGVRLDHEGHPMMVVNEKELIGSPIKEQMYVMAHEGCHVLLSHLLRLTGVSNFLAWNLATDALINRVLNKHYGPWLTEPRDKNGKGMCVTLEKLEEQGLWDPNLIKKSVEELTSEDVYNVIMQLSPPGSKGAKALERMDGERFDDHDPSFDPSKMDGDTKQRIEDLAHAAENKQFGKGAGDFMRDLTAIVKKKFDFRGLLDPIIFKDELDWCRGNRRVRVKGCFIPRRRNEDLKVYAAIDVSGSCYDFTEDFMGYILALPCFEELVLFDTGVTKRIVRGEEQPVAVPGGGGTDLNPVMEEWRIKEEENCGRHKLNFIVLTDGYIPELTTGPKESKVIIMTNGDEVFYKESIQPFINIPIVPEEQKAKRR